MGSNYPKVTWLFFELFCSDLLNSVQDLLSQFFFSHVNVLILFRVLSVQNLYRLYCVFMGRTQQRLALHIQVSFTQSYLGRNICFYFKVSCEVHISFSYCSTCVVTIHLLIFLCFLLFLRLDSVIRQLNQNDFFFFLLISLAPFLLFFIFYFLLISLVPFLLFSHPRYHLLFNLLPIFYLVLFDLFYIVLFIFFSLVHFFLFSFSTLLLFPLLLFLLIYFVSFLFYFISLHFFYFVFLLRLYLVLFLPFFRSLIRPLFLCRLRPLFFHSSSFTFPQSSSSSFNCPLPPLLLYLFPL